jgi:hypothetical protein
VTVYGIEIHVANEFAYEYSERFGHGEHVWYP